MGKDVQYSCYLYRRVKKCMIMASGSPAPLFLALTTTTKAFDKTVEFVIKAKMDVCYFSILTPYPGTRVYEQMLQEGEINEITTGRTAIRTTSFLNSKLMKPEKLLDGFHHALKECFSIISFLNGSGATERTKNFSIP